MNSQTAGAEVHVILARPDVQAAEWRLRAETARTGVATAELFPRIRVTGFVGLLSGDVSKLFSHSAQAWSEGIRNGHAGR